MLLHSQPARLQEFDLVGTAISGIHHADPKQLRPLGGITFYVRSEEHREPSPIGGHDVHRHTVEIAAQIQQRSEVGVVQNTSAYCQQLSEWLAAQRIRARIPATSAVWR